ncbi:MAG: sigma-70 family RNA polymerase sigma factor [Methyloligellaceae bacterium]
MSSSPDALNALIAATASGDQAAFRRLYDATASKLLGVLIRILKRRDLAEEVLQEVFLRIWQRAETYDARQGAPFAWMVTIARNRAIDVTRKRVESALGEGDDDVRLVEQSLRVASDMPDVADRESLRACLEELQPRQRECVILAYCYGYTREELAEKYDVPTGTLKTWVRRALLALRACLER